MGCFWGAERIFWEAEGVYTTAVGYAGGITPNPTYEEVCSGRTGHAEVVLVAFDTAKTSYQEMLRLFWEGHDPTQGMRQGNDVGTQYRSLIMWQGEAQRERRRGLAERLPADALRRRPRHDHHRARRARRRAPASTTPRPTTSSTSPRTPAATAGSAAPASPARSASPPEPRRLRPPPATGALRLAPDMRRLARAVCVEESPRDTDSGPAEAGPLTVLNPEAGASVGRTARVREKRFSPTRPRLPARCRPPPGCHAGAWGPPSVGTSEG